jgi:hypothetical protein
LYKRFDARASKAVSIIRLGDTKHLRQEKPLIKSVCTVCGAETGEPQLGWRAD